MRLLCGRCNRQLDRLERFGGGFTPLKPGDLPGPHNPVVFEAIGRRGDGLAYQCKCGARHRVSLASVRAAADRAAACGADLYAGRRGYGLPA